MKYQIQGYADEYGLDYYDIIFEVLDYKKISEVAAFGGFPARYPHWRFGMEYERLAKPYSYGLSKIYEMVINNDPCYAYLLECNNPVDQKIVMAHVYGHCDFFKNNMWFSKTNRKTIDETANHATRVQRYIERYGINRVEGFIDRCLSVEDLIDMHLPFIKRHGQEEKRERPGIQFDPGCDHKNGCSHQQGNGSVSCSGKHSSCANGCETSVAEDFLEDYLDDEDTEGLTPRKLKSKDYMDEYVNPPEFLEKRKQIIRDKFKGKKRIPEEPQKDILLFLLEMAPLNRWQKDILSMIREEAYYFAPQAQTKIMNEGWATYWHSTIMTQKAMKASELIDYADHHSGTLGGSRSRLNPYKLGVELFRDIEERWNKGRFGKEYEECEDLEHKKKWDLQLGLGREKIFEVRKIYNDITFLDTFLTEEFCHRHKFFMYEYDPRSRQYVIASRGFKEIKQALLKNLTNFGRPFIYVEDGNYNNRGELLLTHRDEGRELEPIYAKDTLTNLQYLWKRPVHLQTMTDEKKILLSFDGENHKEEQI
jgi:stage V sporulation protein R